jgi:hypothetical protein
MPGLVPGIHVFHPAVQTWVAGPSPVTTTRFYTSGISRFLDRIYINGQIREQLERALHGSAPFA